MHLRSDGTAGDEEGTLRHVWSFLWSCFSYYGSHRNSASPLSIWSSKIIKQAHLVLVSLRQSSYFIALLVSSQSGFHLGLQSHCPAHSIWNSIFWTYPPGTDYLLSYTFFNTHTWSQHYKTIETKPGWYCHKNIQVDQIDCHGHLVFDKDVKMCIRGKGASSLGAAETGYLHVQNRQNILIPHPTKKSSQLKMQWRSETAVSKHFCIQT